MSGRRAAQRQWLPTVTGWSESTYAEKAWEASRGAGLRWGLWGALVGALFALVFYAPAAWLSRIVASQTDGRLLLADARGTVWSGSAVMVLTGGPDSRDATSLPGRIGWSLGLHTSGIELRATHPCCLHGTVTMQFKPGFGRMEASLVSPPAEWVGQWPGALLNGLGTPWNTLQVGGVVRLSTPGMTLESVQGRWRFSGQATIDLVNASSRLATLDTLGTYRLTVAGDPATPGTSKLTLVTTQGALQLNGTGTWGAGGVRFRGEGTAEAADQSALNNLLNIIGRRSGARSVISIG